MAIASHDKDGLNVRGAILQMHVNAGDLIPVIYRRWRGGDVHCRGLLVLAGGGCGGTFEAAMKDGVCWRQQLFACLPLWTLNGKVVSAYGMGRCTWNVKSGQEWCV